MLFSIQSSLQADFFRNACTNAKMAGLNSEAYCGTFVFHIRVNLAIKNLNIIQSNCMERQSRRGGINDTISFIMSLSLLAKYTCYNPKIRIRDDIDWRLLDS